MAIGFVSRELSILAYANGFTLWHYRTTDAAPALLERETGDPDYVGYFAPACDLLRRGDLILVSLEGGNADRGRLLAGGEPGFRTGADTEVRRTDDLGRFRFQDLAPGAYELACATPGYKPVALDVTVPEDSDARGIELLLPSGHEIAVRLRDAEGRPVRGMFVTVRLADGDRGGGGRPRHCRGSSTRAADPRSRWRHTVRDETGTGVSPRGSSANTVCWPGCGTSRPDRNPPRCAQRRARCPGTARAAPTTPRCNARA